MSNEDYIASLKQLFTFRSMQEYNEKFEKLKVQDLLSSDISLRVFQSQITPSWEAAENRNGGKFVLSVAEKDASKIQKFWIQLLAVMCHQRFGPAYGNSLVGAVLGMKDWGCSISMWNVRRKRKKRRLLTFLFLAQCKRYGSDNKAEKKTKEAF